MDMNNRISVVINTYNAEAHLAEVLEAVKDFDETVVCDMESTDGTLDIARSYGCRIVTFPKGEHRICEPARMTAIGSATSKWVLVVDADEIVTPELRRYLYEQIGRPGCPAGFLVPRVNMCMGRFMRDWSHDYQLRFFVREGTVWPPVIHSVPSVPGEVRRIPTRYELLHLDDGTVRQWVTKMNEYTDNEVIRKQGRGYGACALLGRPLWRFFRAYIVKGGFLMGRRGLINSLQHAIYQMILVSKMMEGQIRKEK
ncbi:MAG: glycosyltransferase family 2 protein [Prevotella sp.]|nr:glycosyltransferase family 2 protein [Prevotella sp.]